MDVGFLHARNRPHRYVRKSRGHSDNEIVRYVRFRQSLAHKAALAGSEPVLAVRSPTSYFYDVEQVVHGLEVAAIEPAKPVLTSEADHHGVDPLRVVEGVEPALLSR